MLGELSGNCCGHRKVFLIFISNPFTYTRGTRTECILNQSLPFFFTTEIEKEKLCSSEDVEGGGAGAASAGGGSGGGVAVGGGVGVSASLTPAIWEKTIPYDGETFHLEYMDLDEFLLENGIPVSLEEEELHKSLSLTSEEGNGRSVPKVIATATITTTTAAAPISASASSPSAAATSMVTLEPEDEVTVTTLQPAKMEEKEDEEEQEQEQEQEQERESLSAEVPTEEAEKESKTGELF